MWEADGEGRSLARNYHGPRQGETQVGRRIFIEGTITLMMCDHAGHCHRDTCSPHALNGKWTKPSESVTWPINANRTSGVEIWDRKPLHVYVRVGPEFQLPSHAHPGLKMPGWA
jgi:hypothetical protein